MSGVSRRRLLQGGLALGGLGLLAGCGLASMPWQQPSRVRRVGHLAGGLTNARNEVLRAAFRQGLHELGYVEGQNVVIEERRGDGDDQLVAPAAELVRLQPEVILVSSSTVARVAQDATAAIPIVSAGAGNLVMSGLAASYAQPGGNVTGLSTPSLVGKQLQLLREAVPTLSRVAVLFDASIPDFLARQQAPSETAARLLGLHLHFVGFGGPDDLEAAFQGAAGERADGLLVPTGPIIAANQARIAETAMLHRLPSMWGQSESVGRGGMLAYGPNAVDLYRRAALYVDKILKGAKPADLPVEEPTKFDFIVNLATARSLGLAIPPSVLQQATEVIQ